MLSLNLFKNAHVCAPSPKNYAMCSPMYKAFLFLDSVLCRTTWRYSTNTEHGLKTDSGSNQAVSDKRLSMEIELLVGQINQQTPVLLGRTGWESSLVWTVIFFQAHRIC